MNKLAVVTGQNGGLGRLICDQLAFRGYLVIHGPDDVADRKMIEYWKDQYNIWSTDHISVLVNCAGIESINWFEDLSDEEWRNVFRVNVDGPRLMVSELQTQLMRGTVLNISSLAARVPMRCSLAYNASKAALEMMTRQMARELYWRWGTVVFAIAPNKLRDTPMSRRVEEKVCAARGWTKQEADDYQHTTLPIETETDPLMVAEFIGFLLQDREHHRYLNGCIIPYGG